METKFVGTLIVFAILCITKVYGNKEQSSGEEDEILRTVYEILRSDVEDDDGVKEQLSDGPKLTLIERPENMNADEGETVKFTVKLSGNPSPTVAWEKVGDTKWKINNERILVETKIKDSWTLIIKKVSKKDEGLYRCMVTQENKVKMVYISELMVKDNPFVTFIEAPEDISVYEGKTATFTVKLKSYSIPIVKWEKAGSTKWKIDNKRIEVKSDINGTWSLIINKVEKKDAGDYKCIVIDENGSTFVYIKKLSVKDIPFLILNKRPEDVSVFEGKTAKFTIKLRGDPSPIVKWEKVGNFNWKIDKKRIQVQSEINDSWTLIINNVNENDEGLYKCSVTHESGDEYEFIRRLTIKEEVKPTHINTLEDVIVYEGETSTFAVKFSDSQSIIKWEKVGDANWKIDKKRILVQSEMSKSSTLIINEVNGNDEGLYKCMVTDENGSQFIYIRKLIVKALACSSNPCKNGGECHWIEDESDYECICPWPYEGKDCEYSRRLRNQDL